MLDLSAAQAHLRRVDPVLAGIIARHGEFTLKRDRHYFLSLVDAILSQQLSTKAAATIRTRFKDLLNGSSKAAGILQLPDAQFRNAGVSRQKMGYLRDLSEKWQAGLINPRRFAGLSDEEIIAMLTQVKGIGRWTAEMFLIFSLGRMDVLPVDDLGIRNAIKKAYRLRKLPEAKRMQKMAEPWRPYRSLATLYLWESLDNQPL